MKTFFLLMLLGIANLIFAQNLVPNPSFEAVSCVTWPFASEVPISQSPPWTLATNGTADNLNPCHISLFSAPGNLGGNQIARTGVSYGGLFTFSGNVWNPPGGYREYIQVQLTSPLTAGTTYNIGFYYSLGEVSQKASNRLGMYVSNGAIGASIIGPLTAYTPQLEVPGVMTNSSGWTLLSGLYTATGGENYITIGNFYNDANTTLTVNAGGWANRAYYYIDDVVVEAVSTLPIELLSFISACNKGVTTLKWQTASEINNDYFEIQKSENAIDFHKIGEVSGNGNSNKVQSYSFVDENSSRQTVYYRLKQVDFNGAYKYSQIITSNCVDENNELSIYPNPIKNSFTIKLLKNTTYPLQLEVRDYLGRKIHHQIIVSSVTEIKLDKQILDGAYFIKVFNDNEQFVKKIVKINN